MGFPSSYHPCSQKFNFGCPPTTFDPYGSQCYMIPTPQYQLAPTQWTDSLGLSLGYFPTGPARVSATVGASSLGISGQDVPFHHDLNHASSQIFGTYVPSSPSDASSIVSTDTESSPTPEIVHVVCNAPLVAPVPLPYHSPTFLQFDLPDDDEDLSHPPYVSRPHKRKRGDDDDDEESSHRFVIMKRRAMDARHVRWQRAAPQSYTRVPPTGHYPLPAAYFGECARNR